MSNKNKVTISNTKFTGCQCLTRADTNIAPEAAHDQHYPGNMLQNTWSYPATNHLLFQAGGTVIYPYTYSQEPQLGVGDDVGVVEDARAPPRAQRLRQELLAALGCPVGHAPECGTRARRIMVRCPNPSRYADPGT